MPTGIGEPGRSWALIAVFLGVERFFGLCEALCFREGFPAEVFFLFFDAVRPEAAFFLVVFFPIFPAVFFTPFFEEGFPAVFPLFVTLPVFFPRAAALAALFFEELAAFRRPEEARDEEGEVLREERFAAVAMSAPVFGG